MFNIDVTKNYLDSDDWRYNVIEGNGKPFIRTSIKGDNEVFDINILVVDDDILLFRIYDFAKIGNLAIDKKGKLLDIINEMNSNKLFGKVYIDEDNELSFSSAIPINDNSTILSRETFFRLLYSSVSFVDELYPSIMKLVWA